MQSGVMGRLSILGIVVAALSLFLTATDASAQLNNKPFSFSNSGSSLGMSNAARQAILNQKLTGATPDNILRGGNGALIEVSRGPNNIAIARGQDGVALQGYHGRGGVLIGGAGLFNPFFYGNSGQHSGAYTIASQLTSRSIAGWTSMVGGSGPYVPGNSIDAWTSLVGG